MNMISQGDLCNRGKQEWPELVGVKAEVAKEIIERENPVVKAIIVSRDASVTQDYRCDRVWVRTSGEGHNHHGVIVKTPKVG